jgi:hypothetical protein
MSTQVESNIPGGTAPAKLGKKKSTRKQKLLLLACSLLFCALLLMLGELYCRLFLDINFQGNSKELFIAQAFGDSNGNTKSFRAISFGADVFTDAHGFRIDPAFPEQEGLPALLILGDSVGFGVGVEEAKTFAGLLRRELADKTTVYNSSVIGYALPDYRNVVTHFLPIHPEIKQVYLAFCVNDISHQSALAIDAAVKGSERDAVGTVKRWPVIRDVHDFLRCHSKFYLFLKNALTDPSQRSFQYDLDLYTIDDTIFDARMQPLLDIANELKERGISFTVVLEPAQPQLHSTNPAVEVPQKRVGDYLTRHKIRYVDPLETFRAFPQNPSKLYLSGDYCHFSAAGHQLFFEVLWQDLQREDDARK